MKNRGKFLLLITDQYPYGKGETFIDIEIRYLSKEFKIVYILPVSVFFTFKPLNKCMWKIPNNIKVIKWKDIHSYFVIYSIISFFKLIPKAQQNFNNFYFKKEFIIIKQAIKTAIIVGILKSVKIQNIQELIFYSYWKAESAIALGFLRNNGYQNFMITRAHGIDLYNERIPFGFRPFDYLISNYLDVISAISINGREYLIEQGYNQKKTIFYRLGTLNPNKIAKFSKDGIFRIVSCSNLIPLKRVDLIAKSLKFLNIPIEWTHFGDGNQREFVESLIVNLPNNIKVQLKGYAPNKDVLYYYENFPIDLFINVSIFEGIPVTIMEAMSFGIPCLATDVGGTSEIVNNDNGFLVNANITEQELSLIIQSYFNNSQCWIQYRSKAYETWFYKFNADKNYSDFIEYVITKSKLVN